MSLLQKSPIKETIADPTVANNICADASADYGVATISRLHQIIGLFCKRDL